MSIIYRIQRLLSSYKQRNLPEPDYILLGRIEYSKLKTEVHNLCEFNMKKSPNLNDQIYGIDIILVYKDTHMSLGFSERWY